MYSFSSLFVTWQRKNLISCFLSSYTHQVSSFRWYFLIIWPFIYWTLKKQTLETWSCVCGYCAYFCAFACSEILKKTWKSGVGCRQFDAKVHGLNTPASIFLNHWFNWCWLVPGIAWAPMVGLSGFASHGDSLFYLARVEATGYPMQVSTHHLPF